MYSFLCKGLLRLLATLASTSSRRGGSLLPLLRKISRQTPIYLLSFYHNIHLLTKLSVHFIILAVGHITDGSGLPQGSMTGEADRLGTSLFCCTSVSVFLFLEKAHW